MENNKLLSFDGVIGRRGFIINYLAITVIICVVSICLNIILLTLAPSLYNAGLKVILNTASIFLLYPSLERRIKDIFELSERDMNFYLLMLATIFGLCVPLINLFVLIALMAAEGKITGKLPRSEVVRFNWGAFLGTWIWGIFNRSYKTLFFIPLAITPAAIPFALICGLKGNEWSYKNKPVENLEKFHDSQRLQAVIWTILSPVLSILLAITIAVGSVSYIKNFEQKNPGVVKTKVEKVFKAVIKGVNSGFYTNYEKTDEGYKFYVDPKVWLKLSKKDKSTYYILAVYNVMIEEGISTISKEPVNKITNMTKLYSSFNNELLCECIIPETEKLDISELMNAIEKYIKVNEFPSKP